MSNAVRHVIPISGKDSLACALVQTARSPNLPYEFFFNDVQAELPETYAWLAKVEQKTGWNIQRVGSDLPEAIRLYGGFLPGPKSRYCTRQCKIEPMEQHLGTDECIIYYGLRADEERMGYVPFRKTNLQPAYPLRDAGIDLQGVFAVLDAQDLAPPLFFWERLYAAVCQALHIFPGWEQRIGRIERQRLFAGRTRANCYFCFFQRQYEFLWLRETHPDLFTVASAMEKEEYSFQPGFFLKGLDEEGKREEIFDRRVNECCKTIYRRMQGKLFNDSGDNEIALVSCGLLCGK